MPGWPSSTAPLACFAIIIAGVLFTSATGGRAAAQNVASSLIGTERGPGLTDLSILTIRSVAKGILGIALIQAMLSSLGLLAHNNGCAHRPKSLSSIDNISTEGRAGVPAIYDERFARSQMDPIEIQFVVSQRATRNMSTMISPY